jgi:uncharacterized protein YcbX
MKISEIRRYPIASLAGESLFEAPIHASGILGDRAYTLVCERSGDVASPEFVARWQIAPLVAARGHGPELCLRTPMTSWIPAFDPSAKAALDEHFGFGVILRKTGPWRSSVPVVDAVQPRYPRRPLHIVSRRMLTELQKVVPEQAISAQRFRANLIVEINQDDEHDAFLPNTVLEFGDVRLRILESTVRCGFVALAQDGVERSAEALKIIKRDHQMLFGVYADVVQEGCVKIGSAGHRVQVPSIQKGRR